MSTPARLLPPERRALVADALLLTTAAAAAILGLLTLLAEELGDSGWYPWSSTLALLGVVLVCPYIVWRLHGRRGSGASALGVAGGFAAGGAVLWGLLMVVALVSLAASWLTGGTVSEGVAALAIVGALLSALVVALDVDAVRDLARGHHHVGTDVARLLATLVTVVTAGVAVWYSWGSPEEGAAELLAFGLATGVIGAVIALGADVTVGMREPSTSAS